MRGITLRAIKKKNKSGDNWKMEGKKKKNLRKYHIEYEQRIDPKHNAFQIIFIEIMYCKFYVYLSPFVAWRYFYGYPTTISIFFNAIITIYYKDVHI